MKTKKYISTLLNGIFILTVLLFVFDGLTSFEIKNQAIKSFTYFGLMVLTPMTLVWNLWTLKTRKWKIISSILPTIALIGIMIIGPMKIMFSSGSWKTQTVLYQNGHLTFKKVEFQMQDVGALGYNKRTVEVIYLTNLFMVVSPVEKDIDERVEWIKVDKEVNELGLKFP
jgi:hypothetical protein